MQKPDLTGLKPLGLALIALALLLPIVGFAPLAAARDPIALFSQYLGAAALIAMAISQLIATRWPGVEAVFGGLDKGYVLHKWLGIGAMVAVLLHDTIDAEMDGLGRETVLVEIAETLGEISLYGLLALVILTIATFVPYHLWRWTHRIIGLFFGMAALHYLFILKPFSNGDLLGLYVGTWCAVGVLAYAWTQRPVRAGAQRYRIEAMEETGGAVALTLAPEGRGMRHRAGQFAFLSFAEGDMGAEPHPFTLSNAPQDDRKLRLSIRALGDYSARLATGAAIGQAVRVEGPYGAFARPKGEGPQVWVAAGIGITPFLAWLGDGPQQGPVTLVWAVRGTAGAPHLAEVRAAVEADPQVTLHLLDSQAGARLSASRVVEAAPDLPTAQVFYCGPSALREVLKTGLAEAGLPRGAFHAEAFEIRTGLGLRRLSAWLMERALARGEIRLGRSRGAGGSRIG